MKRKVVLLIALGIFAASCLLTVWVSAVPWPWKTSIFKSGSDIKDDQESLIKEKIDNYSKRADDLQKLLSLQIAISTIYALAIGVNAYQQAKESREKLDKITKDASDSAARSQSALERIEREAAQSSKAMEERLSSIANAAEHKLDKIAANAEAAASASQHKLDAVKERVEQQADRIRDQVYRVFPMFENMELRIQRVMSDLVGLLPRLDISEGKFDRISEFDKQRVQFYEKTVAAWEFLDPRPLETDTVAEIFHSLGNFYAMKSGDENKRAKSPDISPIERQLILEAALADRERSRYYLDRALQINAWNVGTLNDRGYLALELDVPKALEDARGLFERSLRAHPQHQRAAYDLALTLHHLGQDEEAIRISDSALHMPIWQTVQEHHRVPEILYNGACFRTCLARKKGESSPEYESLLESAMRDLENAFAKKEIDWPSIGNPFLEDLEPGSDGGREGDLFPLARHPNFGTRIRRIEDQVRKVLGKQE